MWELVVVLNDQNGIKCVGIGHADGFQLQEGSSATEGEPGAPKMAQGRQETAQTGRRQRRPE